MREEKGTSKTNFVLITKLCSPPETLKFHTMHHSRASSGSPVVAVGKTPLQQKLKIVKRADGSTCYLLPKPNPSRTFTIQRNSGIVPGPSPATPIQPRSKIVNIQSLGSNTVTIKDGQLIVRGPDHEAATGIAKKLASGEAKLGNVNGKQVLVMLEYEKSAPTPQAAVPTPPKVPVQAPPAPAPAPALAPPPVYHSKARGRGRKNSHPGLPRRRPLRGAKRMIEIEYMRHMRQLSSCDKVEDDDTDDPDDPDDSEDDSLTDSEDDSLTDSEDDEYMPPVGQSSSDDEDEDDHYQFESDEEEEKEEDEGDFMRSLRTRIDELATVRGFKTDLMFVKPLGYKYIIG